MNKIHGLVVAVLTPTKDGAVDTESLKKLINHIIEGGVDALFILGTTGEFWDLSYEEKVIVLNTSIEANAGRIPLLVGVSEKTIDETRKLIELTNNAKVDGVVLAPVFGEGDVEEKIKLTEETSKLPIMLYNNPAISGGKKLALDIVEKASKNPRIIGLKDSSGNDEYFDKIVKFSSDNFGVFQGWEIKTLRSLEKGAVGLVSGSSNAFPKEFKAVVEEKSQDRLDEALKKMDVMLGYYPNYIRGIKKELVNMGIIETDEMFA